QSGTAAVRVDEPTAVLGGLEQHRTPDDAHNARRRARPERVPPEPIAAREGPREDLDGGDAEEDVARGLALLLVLLDERASAWNPLHRSVRGGAGLHRKPGGHRANQQQRRSRIVRELEPRREGYQSTRDADEQQRDDEVNDLWMKGC